MFWPVKLNVFLSFNDFFFFLLQFCFRCSSEISTVAVHENSSQFHPSTTDYPIVDTTTSREGVTQKKTVTEDFSSDGDDCSGDCKDEVDPSDTANESEDSNSLEETIQNTNIASIQQANEQDTNEQKNTKDPQLDEQIKLTKDTKVALDYMFGVTTGVGVVGVVLNSLSIASFRYMDNSNTYIYMAIILKCDTFRLICCVLVSIMIKIFGDSVSKIWEAEPKSVIISYVTCVQLFSSMLSSFLEMCMSTDRRLTIMEWYYSTRRPPFDPSAHPQIMTSYATGVVVVLAVMNLGGFYYPVLVTNLVYIVTAVTLLFKLFTLKANIQMLAALVRFTNRMNKNYGIEGPRMIHHNHVISTTKAVLAVTLVSLGLTLPQVFICFYYVGIGVVQQALVDPNLWIVGIYTVILPESISCVNFLLYLCFIKSFRTALKKVTTRKKRVGPDDVPLPPNFDIYNIS